MRAVLIFCEGNHDIAFATRSLGALAGAQWVKKPIKELPSPFGPLPDPRNPIKPKVESLIARRYSERSLDNLQLRAAAHPPPPVFETLVEVAGSGGTTTLYALVRSHGDGAASAAIELLNDLSILLPLGVQVTQIAAAFLFDADDTGVAHRETRFAAEHAPLLNGGVAPKHGQWVQGASFPVGLYVFHDTTTSKGTLEAILAPLVEAEWPARWREAGAYLTAHAAPDDPVTRTIAEQQKAQICITGQFGFPGDPMSQVIGRDGLPRKHFQGPASQALVDFLVNAPW